MAGSTDQGSTGSTSGLGRTKIAAAVSHDQRLLTALFTVLAKINHDLSIPQFLAVLLFVVDGVQMLWFALNPDPVMPLIQQPYLGTKIINVMAAVWFMPPSIYFAPLPLWIVFALFASLPLLLLGYSVYVWYLQDDIVGGIKIHRPEWPISVLRWTGRFTLALFIPICLTLLSALDCDSSAANPVWQHTSYTCWSSLHALFAAISVLLLPPFVAYCFLTAATMIKRIPDRKQNLLSQAQGRVSVVMLALKLLLSILFTFGATSDKNVMLLLIGSLVAGLAWLVVYARFMPYHQRWLNEMQCAMAGVHIAGAVSQILAFSTDFNEWSIGAWVFLFTAPLAAPLGWGAAYLSSRSYNKRRELSSPYSVELKARYMIADADEAAPASTSALPSVTQLNANGTRQLTASNHSGTDATGSGANGQSKGGAGAPASGASGALGVPLNERGARLRDIQLLYEDATQSFSGSAMLELFSATFLGVVQRNRHLELLHLRRAEDKVDSSSIDIRFFVWERLYSLDKDETKSNSLKTSVVRRMQFDTLRTESEELSMRARQLILDYWTESCEHRPDMARMQHTGAEIIAAIRRTENIYSQLLELSPQSTAVMRACADFLLEIANDPKRAFDLLQSAEQIEEDESKARAALDADIKDYPFMAYTAEFDLSNENVSLLRISGEPGKLGMIVDANPAALKLFGYGRRELIGKNVNSLVPEPISAVHQRFLEKYMITGEEYVVNTSRNYLGLHRSGYIFPMACNIKPLEEGFGGVMEAIVTSQSFLFFLGHAGRWRVTAACKNTMSALGITADQLHGGAVTMDRVLPLIAETNAGNGRNRAGGRTARHHIRHEHGGMHGDGSEDEEWEGVNEGGEDPSNHGINGMASTARSRYPADGSAPSSSTLRHRSRLMNELINISGSQGQSGLDIHMRVYEWSEVASESARQQRLKYSHQHEQDTELSSPSGTQSEAAALSPFGRSKRPSVGPTHMLATHQGRTGHGTGYGHAHGQTLKPLRLVHANARLQEVVMPFLAAPLYVLRWRPSKGDSAELDLEAELEEMSDHEDDHAEFVATAKSGASKLGINTASKPDSRRVDSSRKHPGYAEPLPEEAEEESVAGYEEFPTPKYNVNTPAHAHSHHATVAKKRANGASNSGSSGTPAAPVVGSRFGKSMATAALKRRSDSSEEEKGSAAASGGPYQLPPGAIKVNSTTSSAAPSPAAVGLLPSSALSAASVADDPHQSTSASSIGTGLRDEAVAAAASAIPATEQPLDDSSAAAAEAPAGVEAPSSAAQSKPNTKGTAAAPLRKSSIVGAGANGKPAKPVFGRRDSERSLSGQPPAGRRASTTAGAPAGAPPGTAAGGRRASVSKPGTAAKGATRKAGSAAATAAGGGAKGAAAAKSPTSRAPGKPGAAPGKASAKAGASAVSPSAARLPGMIEIDGPAVDPDVANELATAHTTVDSIMAREQAQLQQADAQAGTVVGGDADHEHPAYSTDAGAAAADGQLPQGDIEGGAADAVAVEGDAHVGPEVLPDGTHQPQHHHDEHWHKSHTHVGFSGVVQDIDGAEMPNSNNDDSGIVDLMDSSVRPGSIPSPEKDQDGGDAATDQRKAPSLTTGKNNAYGFGDIHFVEDDGHGSDYSGSGAGSADEGASSPVDQLKSALATRKRKSGSSRNKKAALVRANSHENSFRQVDTSNSGSGTGASGDGGTVSAEKHHSKRQLLTIEQIEAKQRREREEREERERQEERERKEKEREERRAARRAAREAKQVQMVVPVDAEVEEEAHHEAHANFAKVAKSHRSGSIMSGSSAGSSTTEALRKGIELRSRGMESSLVTLRRSLILIFVLVGIMNIASVVLSNVLFNTLMENLGAVADNGLRGILLQEVYSDAQRLALMAQGVLGTPDNASATRTTLAAHIEELASIHQSLYNRVDENVASERDLYVVPSIVVRDLIGGTWYSPSNYSYSNRTINMGNAGLEFVAKARVLNNRDYRADATDDGTGVSFWLLENGPKPIRTAFNESMLVAQDKTDGQGTTILLATDIVVCLALGLLFLVTVLVMIPAISGVVSQKAVIFEIFLHTPLPILRSLRASMDEKISSIHRANEEAEAGLDIGGRGDASGLAGPMMIMGGEGVHGGYLDGIIDGAGSEQGSASRPSTHSGGGSETGPLGRLTAAAMNHGGTGKANPQHARRFKRSARVGVRALFMLLWPIVLLCAYYLSTWAWKRKVAQQAEYARSEVFYANQVQFFVGQSNFNLRNVLAYCDWGLIQDQYTRFSTLIATMESVQDGLLYGSESRHVRPLLKTLPSYFHLMMEDGCVPSATLYDSDSCHGRGSTPFYDGLVGKGLQGAYKQYVSLAKRTMQDRYDLADPSSPSSSSCTPEDMLVGNPILLESLSERYLAAGFAAAAGFVVDDTFSYLKSFMAIDIAVTCGCILALFLFFFLVYQPLIRELDREIKNVRHLLLLFPDEVSKQVPSIIAAGRTLLTQDVLVHTSSAASMNKFGSAGSGPSASTPRGSKKLLL